MKVLPPVKPTDEQLKIISRIHLGEEVIRGSAGSGKTTTAILRLRGLLGFVAMQRMREHSSEPIKTLVLTFNRTLRGYIEELVQTQVRTQDHKVEYQVLVETFGHWAHSVIQPSKIIAPEERDRKINDFARGFAFESRFLSDEIDYILGRFLPEDLTNYISCERIGRGNSPRVDATMRARILDEVVRPYSEWKQQQDLSDWNDLQITMATATPQSQYDVIIADEAQDFSANQIRAALKHRASRSSIIFILDTAQRIYPRGFHWREVNLSISSNNSYRLQNNYRNTKQIAALALPLISGIFGDEVDATIPNLEGCERIGSMPQLWVGRYRDQVTRALEVIKGIPADQSIAFLHPVEWFSYLKSRLEGECLRYVSITRQSEWPVGLENIALSTISSAKGLEFDHILILGLSNKALSHGPENDDSEFLRLRRLLAMGICRARESVVLGTNPLEESDLLKLLEPGSFDRIAL